MKKRYVLAAALLGTLLLAVPLQSQAFFGFFGGGFSFGTGWGGWGGPGWWGPGWHRGGYYGLPYSGWYRPYRDQFYWRRLYRRYGWPYFDYGLPLPYVRLPSTEEPVAITPSEPKEK
ncbi:hypothetical protein F2Q65_18125 [Thiohalocapsa marina]|uniref:Sulfur globule protein CV3 n=1 Tax=Thiohalocapsa marina TaxID=424902 RepID=A0A5M8FBQ8_9GAMM|nr:hypothetical protein [Thiohalocapsa marina]KAA6182308.1 hypothetical protein F2Q65_18125 [Thiohalocapsa marina]